MAKLKITKEVFVADLSRTLNPGSYEIGDGAGEVPKAVAEQIKKYSGWAVDGSGSEDTSVRGKPAPDTSTKKTDTAK